MPTLLNLIKEITTDIPDILSSNESIFIRGRNITPNAQAKCVAKTMQGDWHELTLVMFIQEHAIDNPEWTPEGEIEALKADGLSEDWDIIEILEQVVTAKEVSQLLGIKVDTVLDACEKKQILSRRSGTTYLMYLPDAKKRWDKK